MKECSDIRLLYIEDDPGTCEDFKRSLKKTGNKLRDYVVDTAPTGEQGLSLCAKIPYALVVIDCQLPDMSGIAIAHQLLAVNSDLPLLMIACKGKERLAVEAMTLGIANYVIKDEEQTYLEIIPLLIEDLLARANRRRKQIEAEGAMQKSEQKFRSLVAASPVCIHEIDLHGKLLSMNPAGLEMMGIIAESEICGLDYLDVPIPEDRARIQGLMEAAKQGESSRFEFQAFGKNGVLHFSSSFGPIKNVKGNVVRLMGMTEDITERKLAEKALREARNDLEFRVEERTTKISQEIVERRQAEQDLAAQSSLFELALNSIDQGFVVWDENQRMVICNNRFWEFFGVPLGALSPGIFLIDLLRFLARGGYYGEGDPETLAQLRYQEIEEAKDQQEQQYITKSGRELFIRRYPVKNLGRISTFTDITDNIKREEQLKYQVGELRENEERMETQAADLVTLAENLSVAHDEMKVLNAQKDKFFSIIAHDLKSPFTALLGFSSLLSDQGARLAPGKAAEYGSIVHQSAEQVFRLLENLLEWSLLQMGRMDFDPGPVDLKALIDVNLTLFHPIAAKKAIRLTCDLNPNLGKNISGNLTITPVADPHLTVLADFHMVDTILRNLINNAIKFTPDQGEVTISARRNGEWIELEVSDTGVGISKERASRLFRLDEYSTTKGTKGETGTGLGLHLCKDLVERQGGKIQVESSKDKGTKFSITLPLYSEEIHSRVQQVGKTVRL